MLWWYGVIVVLCDGGMMAWGLDSCVPTPGTWCFGAMAWSNGVMTYVLLMV